MKFFIGSLLALSIFASEEIFAADPNPAYDELFAQLHHEDMDVRIAALRDLQTTIDPRLPEELMRLLRDEGDSTRRLAARGIGSRYWQIPEERRPDFIAALKAAGEADPDNLGRMVGRAIALLSGTYDSPTMSRSANDRWVIYERYSLPCLIDTRNGTEELLGWKDEESDRPFFVYGIGLDPDISPWHPEKEILVLVGSLNRRMSTAVGWVHRVGFRILGMEQVLDALGIDERRFLGPGGFYCDHVGWDGDRARIQCSFTVFGSVKQVETGENVEMNDIDLVVLWDPATGKVEKER